MTAITPTRNPFTGGYSALTIANKFLELARQQGKTLTQMQVHKLVYIAHGYSMALLGRPLIYHTVHAWERGPVIPALRDQWGRGAALGHGRQTLSVGAHEPDLTAQEDDRAYSIVKSVWDSYGDLPGERLSEITHQTGSPWEQVYGRPTDLIPDEITRAYYTSLVRS